MNEEPKDLRSYIAAGLRASAERAEAAKKEQEAQQARKQQAQAVAVDALQHVVSPQLEEAAALLSQAGMTAEVGNGRDSYGCLRRSLTLVTAHGGDSVRLVFTVMEQVPVPFLGIHHEPAPPMRHIPTQVPATTPETIRRLIGEFITNHMP